MPTISRTRFHFDDAHVIEQNTYIRDLGNIPLFFTLPESTSTLPTNRSYRPVLLSTFAIDHWLAGGTLDPFYFHLQTFAWLLLQAALMVVLYRTILDRASPHPWNPVVALVMTGAFCLHTANAETINYISARSDSLSTLCVVAAFVLYLRGGRARWLLYPVLVVGLLVKETTLMFVPMLAVYQLLFEEKTSATALATREGLQAAGRVAWRIAPIAIVGTAGFLFTQQMMSDSWTPGGSSAFRYAITQPWVLLRYFWTFFFPVGLSADTDWTTLASVFDARFVIGTIFLIGALGVATTASREPAWRPVSFGLFWFFLALAPTSSVIPLSEVTNDHRMFFPFVGLMLSVGWTIALALMAYETRLRESGAARVAVAAGLVVILGGHALGVVQRNEVWRTEESLWRDVTEKSPGNGRGLMNYGLSQMSQGRYEVALDYYERARETDYGNHPYLFTNMAIAQNALGRVDEAEANHREAVRIGVNYPAVHHFFADWLYEQERHGEALRHVETALSLSPGHEGAQTLRTRLASHADDAVAEAEAAVARDATPDAWLNLSLAYFNTQQMEASIDAAEQALALDPDYAPAHNNICSAFNVLERWDDAIAACEQALALAPDYELARNNLNWARAQRGDTAPD